MRKAAYIVLLVLSVSLIVWLLIPVSQRTVNCTVEMTYNRGAELYGWLKCTGVLRETDVELPKHTEVLSPLICTRLARFIPGTDVKIPFTRSHMKDCKPPE